jgi:hypothetical protein
MVLRKNNPLESRRKLQPFGARSRQGRRGTGCSPEPLSAHADPRRKPKHVSAVDSHAVLRRRGWHNCAVRADTGAGSGTADGRKGCYRRNRADTRSGGRGAVRAQRQSAGAIALTPARPPCPPRAGFGPAPILPRTRSLPPACRAAATGTRERASSRPLRPNGPFWHPFPTVRRAGKICNPQQTPS